MEHPKTRKAICRNDFKDPFTLTLLAVAGARGLLSIHLLSIHLLSIHWCRFPQDPCVCAVAIPTAFSVDT